MLIAIVKTKVSNKNHLKEMKELKQLKQKLRVGKIYYLIQKKWLTN